MKRCEFCRKLYKPNPKLDRSNGVQYCKVCLEKINKIDFTRWNQSGWV